MEHDDLASEPHRIDVPLPHHTPDGRAHWQRGEHLVLVPVDVSHAAPQLIDPRTGELRTFGTPPSKDEEIKPQVTLASDGVAVLRDGNTVTAYDSSGTVVDTYKRVTIDDRFTSDAPLPTLEQLKSFYTDETAPWTTGLVSRSRGTDHSRPSLEVSSTENSETPRMLPDWAFLKEYNEPNFSRPSRRALAPTARSCTFGARVPQALPRSCSPWRTT